jgi:hypothetical protein
MITLLGLPITKDSINSELINFLNKKEKITIFCLGIFDKNQLKNNNDYLLAKVGYDLLFKSVHEIIHLPIWYNNGVRRQPCEVFDELISTMNEYHKNNPEHILSYALPGSPYYEDYISGRMINDLKNITVIDTKSSGQLIYDLIDRKELFYHHVDIMGKGNSYFNYYNFTIKKHAVNVISCLGPGYQKEMHWLNKFYLLYKISKKDEIYSIRLGSNVVSKKLSKTEFKYLLENKTIDMNQTTYVIIKE